MEIAKKDRAADVGDKIQQLQYDWFIENLTGIEEKLSQCFQNRNTWRINHV